MRFREHQDQARAATRRLLLSFVAVLLLLVGAVNGVLALIYKLTLPWTSGFPEFFFETNTGLVLLFVLGGCWFEMLRLREGGAHVARLAGGRRIDEPGGPGLDLYEKRLRNVVDEVAIACNVKPPEVWVLPREDAINAFAAGWQIEDAVVAVTRGALERLTRDELQGVVAHEFSHLVHGDTRLNMRLIGLVWGLQMIYTFGHSLVEPDEQGHRSPALLFGLGLMAVGSLGWLAGRLLQAAVSRQREYLADASAVKFTRSVQGIGGALRKIADQAWRRQDALHHPQADSLSHLFFVSRLRWSALFATHPPLNERIRRIYGHAVGPLPARQLAPEDDDAPDTEPMPGVVLSFAVGAARRAAAQVLSPPAEPEARRHDPVQRAVLDPVASGQDEALGRIRHWHGPGERKAAVLALLLTPGNDAELKAWQQETESTASAPGVLCDVRQLTHAARLPVLELLLRRSATVPVVERRAMLEAARRVMGADGHASPLDRLLWLAMRRLLGGPPVRPEGAAKDIRELARAIAVLTAFLARIVAAGLPGTPPGLPPLWWRSVWRALMGDQPLPPWRLPDGDALVQAVYEVATLSAMQRPVLLRTWVDTAVQLSPQGRLDEPSADALRLMALLLDTPAPPALAGLYIDVGTD
ncbi:M48 family metallopeptidase [Aquabacterium sp. A7-Y]|uniref:M48 family metallopeptidase n=1 Tax=Aquabacterium sp. A7-Y TaxID=1349605 RepID=UPI00223E5E01|nr:M48 family metallopeptidase [Aquabacterium sp. A7-Y]MCW7536682.1 M48 family metallopeptidase [Aquabacterium sp. A7-Y]